MLFKAIESCPIHKIELRKGQIKIIYGLQVGKAAQQINTKLKAEAKLFPLANSVSFGSCLAPIGHDFEYKSVKFCSQCRQVEYDWENQHWDARQIRDFSGRFVAVP